jgi:tight adherence protein B
MSLLEKLAHTQDLRELVARGSAFLFVFLGWSGLVWIWWMRLSARRRRVSERLGLADSGTGPARELRLWSQGKEFTTLVANPDVPMSLRNRLEAWREDARIEAPMSTLVLGIIGLVGGVFLLLLVISKSLPASAGGVVVTGILLWAYAKQRVQRNAVAFDAQFMDALELAARSLRAGHPLTGAFELAAQEVPAPVGAIFQEICQQQELGVSLEDALRKASTAHASSDLKLFATSVVIQLESGGNLAEMMSRLATVIRERTRLSRHARTLTAQTQLSKRILLALPFALFVMINTLNPGYMEPLYTTADGRFLLMIGSASLVFGMWVMDRLTALRY